MKNLDKKLKNLEDEIVENRLQKKQRRERIDKRDSLIHEKFIKIWNEKVAKNKKFKSDLDKIISRFKKINPRSNRYYWMLQEDILIKERVKSIVIFYINNLRISLELRLYGNSTEIVCSIVEESYSIKDIEKVKSDFINGILKIFQDQNKN
tara:strand:- start:10 stop:462 length:453 start_codon:yes stop_codon:yes gene_type:complete